VLSAVVPAGCYGEPAAGVPAPETPYAVRALVDGGFVRRMPPIGDGGATVFDLVLPRPHVAAVADRLLTAGAAPAGIAAFDALRVEARRPRFGVDTDHRTIPNELPWLTTAVHLDKGCYRGQETVARVHNLGRPPRRLVLLHLDGVSEVLAEPGTPVLAGTREVGRVGSVVRHHELGVVALALVKQSVAMDAVLTVAGSTAAIDPEDAPAEPDDTTSAARERVRAVRSATIGR
jgi:folate-binding protein YgfZ